MNAPNTIEEGDVLLATIRFLLGRKAIPYQVSVATGQGIDAEQIKSEVRRIFGEVPFKPTFKGAGPDVVAVSEDEWWQVECKGAGTGKPQTQRNNFDRALASVVSYYDDDTPENLPNWAQATSPFLGLALPASTTYLRELTPAFLSIDTFLLGPQRTMVTGNHMKQGILCRSLRMPLDAERSVAKANHR